jgi:hypothetical protein
MSAYRYHAYGMGIESQIYLPELCQAAVETDLVICRGDNRESLSEIPDKSRWIRLGPSEAVLYLKNTGTIIVRDGDRVVVDMDPLVDPGLIRQCLLGAVMGVVLGQRGKLVLHAGSVQVGGRAIAFLGDSGQGKSSLAAALVARGHHLIADDVTAVEFDPFPAVVPAGVAHLKIGRNVASALGFADDDLMTLWSGETKAGLRLPTILPGGTIPLSHIFILEEGDNVQIVPLRHAEAVFGLIVNSYPTCLPEQADTTRMFRCSKLVEAVPVYRLTRTGDLVALPKLAEAIEKHLHLA